LDQVEEKGSYLRQQLEKLKSKHPIIQEVRGLGLLVGARLNTAGAPIVKECMARGYLINCVQDNILRFIPPLIISKEEIDGMIQCLDEVIKKEQSSDR
ncbi:MAG: aminotransferase class III-fold pyridoxal phosphate-dependent enzyme, partial [Desulfobacteraceae bacterium]|nr:aminotransferase class III-fold pyridoxal phosphate-dependent enzyme [Desulfobacteraceae bacterium]